MQLKFIGLLCALLLFANIAGANTIKIKINAMANPASTKALVTAYLTKLLEERSHGRIQVEMTTHFNPTTQNVIQELNRDTTQIVIPEIGDLLNEAPQLRLFELPFLFRDREHLHQVIDNHVGQTLIMDGLRQKLKILGIWEKDAKHLQAESALLEPKSVSKKFYQGRKDQTSTVFFKTLSACSPRPQAGSRELKNWEEVTLSEVAKHKESGHRHITLTQHSFSGCILLIDKYFWSSLPDDLKIIVADAVKDATTYSRELAQQVDQEALEQLQNQKNIQVSKMSQRHRQLWRNNMLKLYTETCNGVEKKLIEQVANYQTIN